jgi:hypothetical protein
MTRTRIGARTVEIADEPTMRKRRLVPTLALGLVLAVGFGGEAHAGRDADAKPLRVLFVGNSLTATNDLPSFVASLAKRGGRRIQVGSVTGGGYNLEDHWNDGRALAALRTRAWDVVVMQQGPSALPESQVDLRRWAIRWADEARAAGTSPALLTVWPESYRKSALRDVIASYRRAAEAARAELLPAGAAWRTAWRCDPRLPLYGPDGFHPSGLGTYTAALVVYGRLFKAPLVGIRALMPTGVTQTRARLLQRSAATALGRRLSPPLRCAR